MDTESHQYRGMHSRAERETANVTLSDFVFKYVAAGAPQPTRWGGVKKIRIFLKIKKIKKGCGGKTRRIFQKKTALCERRSHVPKGGTQAERIPRRIGSHTTLSFFTGRDCGESWGTESARGSGCGRHQHPAGALFSQTPHEAVTAPPPHLSPCYCGRAVAGLGRQL